MKLSETSSLSAPLPITPAAPIGGKSDQIDIHGSTDPLLTVSDLYVRQGGDSILNGVNLEVTAGEIVTVIGPNGSGKTTLIKTVLGLLPPDSGRIKRAPGIRIGYVPQRLTIDTTLPLTVARLMTVTGPASPASVEAALARLDIGHLANAPIQQLSGGEFQRALIARAILRKPDLLIMDEPVQGVDFAGQVALYELIGDLRHELGCGILLISHDLHFVMAETDRVICLNRHVCCSGSPKSVAADPEYRRLFGPRAVEALAVYRHHHDHAHGPDGEIIPLAGNGEASPDLAPGRAHSHGDGAVCHHDHGAGPKRHAVGDADG